MDREQGEWFLTMLPPALCVFFGQSIGFELSSGILLPGSFRAMWGYEKPAASERVVSPVGNLVKDGLRHRRTLAKLFDVLIRAGSSKWNH